MTEDLLEALLRAALAEKSLDAATLPRFAEALRARAGEILAERVQPIEERAAAFEKESAWRAEIAAGLEKDKEYWIAENERGKEEIRLLEQEQARLQREHEGVLEERQRLIRDRDQQAAEIGRLKAELEAGQAQQRETSEAHDRLVAQQREASEAHDRLLAQYREASEAHDRLLAHHRQTLLRIVERLQPLTAGLPWSYRRVRAEIEDLVQLLRKEGP